MGQFQDGVAYIRVFSNASGVGTVFKFLHAMDQNADDTSWYDNTAENVTVGAAATGLFKIAIASPAMFMRWNSTGATGAIVFSVDLIMNALA